jgi:hypothetical protein
MDRNYLGKINELASNIRAGLANGVEVISPRLQYAFLALEWPVPYESAANIPSVPTQ